jgi:lanthanide-dependent methanol dehydrogenase
MVNQWHFSPALALLTSCFLVASGLAAADPDLDQQMRNPDNWAAQAGDAANHRWSNLKQIDRDNVGQLQVAWTMSTGVLRGHEGSPLVIGDTIYLHTPFPDNVFAVSLKDQTFKWKYEPKQDPDVVPVMCCDTVSRGLAYGDGKIFLQQADTTLAACWPMI